MSKVFRIPKRALVFDRVDRCNYSEPSPTHWQKNDICGNVQNWRKDRRTRCYKNSGTFQRRMKFTLLVVLKVNYTLSTDSLLSRTVCFFFCALSR